MDPSLSTLDALGKALGTNLLGMLAAEALTDAVMQLAPDAGETGPRSMEERLANLYEAVATALEVIAPRLQGLTQPESERLHDAMRRLAS